VRDAQLVEQGTESGVIARAHARRVEVALGDRRRRVPAAQRREADPFRGHRIRQPRGVSHQHDPLLRQRPRARTHGDHETVPVRGARRNPQNAQVPIERGMQVGRTAPHAQDAHREMGGLGEDPRVPVRDDPHVEARCARKPLQRGVVHLQLVLERGDQVPTVAPPRLAGDRAHRPVCRHDECRRDRARVRVEPDMVVLVAHAGHAAGRPEVRSRRRRAGREQEVQPVPHRHPHDRRRAPRREEVEVFVRQVDLGRGVVALHHPLHLGREQVETASH